MHKGPTTLRRGTGAACARRQRPRPECPRVPAVGTHAAAVVRKDGRSVGCLAALRGRPRAARSTMAEMMTGARTRQWIVAASVGVLLLSLAEDAAAAGAKVAPDAELSELLGVGLVVAQLVFHVLLHHLEHYVGHSHPSLLPILRTVYRELLILGFVSFTFILAATFGKFGDELFVSFEFAHLLIFLLAVFYIIVVLATTWASLSLSARWQEIESMEFVTYLANKQEFTELKTERERHRNYLWRWVLWWKGNPWKLERFHYLHERMAFHDSRFQFLYYRALPEDFSFSAYLRKVKTQVRWRAMVGSADLVGRGRGGDGRRGATDEFRVALMPLCAMDPLTDHFLSVHG